MLQKFLFYIAKFMLRTEISEEIKVKAQIISDTILLMLCYALMGGW